MEKKISFGFSKVLKKSNIINNFEQKEIKKKVELIKCLEGQAIQLVEKTKEESPLIIPLKDGGKTSAALQSLRTRQAILNNEEIVVEEKTSKNGMPAEINLEGDDIEKRAARELLAELGKVEEQEGSFSNLVLPLKAEDLPLDGAKAPTIDDYESIPVQQFGKAMLRGMGWKDEPKKTSTQSEGPILRPKGMGLGADKALKPKSFLVPPEANEILEIKKDACVRVLGGKNKDLYGQIEGLDDHAGRVIVKMALGGCKESFNEFMVQPVSKKEYSQYSKCINSNKYDEYKRLENEHGQIIPKVSKEEQNGNLSKESHNTQYTNTYSDEKQSYSSSRSSKDCKVYCSKSERRSRSPDRHDQELARSSRSHRSHRKKHRSKSENSSSSPSSSDHRYKHKKSSKKSKHRKREKRHSSCSSSNDESRHKRKTKKSKRERSRSKGRR